MAVLEFGWLTNPGIEGHTNRKSIHVPCCWSEQQLEEIYCSIWPGCFEVVLVHNLCV